MSNKAAMMLGLAVIAGVLTMVLGFYWIQRSDWDRMCSVMTSAVTDPAYAKMDPAQRAAIAAQQIDGSIYGPAARNTFSAISYAEPTQRAALMRSAAEETLGKPWDCPALDKFFPNESPEKK